MTIVTRSTVPVDNIVRLADWRPRYENARNGELGHPVVEVQSPTKTLYLRERAIESSLRDYAAQHSLTGAERAATIACALRWFRQGSSAAKAIAEGQKRARELAWGNKPSGGAA